MAEPVSLTLSGSKAVIQAVGGILALKRAPEEAEIATRGIQFCQKKVNELIKLRNRHLSLLEQDLDHLDALDAAINEAFAAHETAMPAVERNRTRENRVEKCSPRRIFHPIRWAIMDHRTCNMRLGEVNRTNVEVENQIRRLQDTVRDWRSNSRQDSRNMLEAEQEAQGGMEDEQTADQADASKGVARLFRVVGN
ncbi:hypothetical protein QBC40DRAFT_265753 [Triangularia verruculosa]|uniref:Uncharacterized protein n=1 Tax=Triangularia verruculosa TaxID=2587418 RepID=A0AAN7AW12_9PEZI|nr:hypothetical protein QBC40DRAFT_265753 [Triangularia verruculosa]